jgi:multidrug efflux pump subunit AcrB
VVVALSLVASRIVSMTFIPLLGYYLLRGQKGLEEGGDVRTFFLFRPVDLALNAILPRYRKFLGYSLRRYLGPIAIAYGLLAASFLLTRFFGTQFFPPAERNQLIINVELPQSASIVQTRAACATLAEALKTRPEIESAAVFIGGTAPRFYYNYEPAEPAENLAMVLINTRTEEDIAKLLPELRAELDRKMVGARCVVKQLDQGPGIETPIQIRVSGPDLNGLRSLADQVSAVLREAGGYKVYDDLGLKVPALEIKIDQDRANLLGVVNPSIGDLTRGAFADYQVTELREGDHVVPVLIRLRAAERNAADKIKSLYVFSAQHNMIPIEAFAQVGVSAEYPLVPHYNKVRTVTVKAYSRYGELPSAVVARAQPKLAAIQLPPLYRLVLAGEDKELRSSQADMLRVMAISIALIALTMVMQFRSLIKSLVVMLTVPLGLIGAYTGLAVTRAEFGFTALLGIVSLAGVIVSHIIVLSDYIEEARAEGKPLEEALIQSGLVRLRAVLVTVLATVGGLIPLYLSGGALWKPLTAVHIFGLLFATVLTLVVLPVLYYVFCAKLKLIKG